VPDTDPPVSPSEFTCPSCGAIFSIASLGKRRRVQCPKCREVVTVDRKSPTDLLESLKGELNVLRAEVERLSELEGRVFALEIAMGLRVEPIAEPTEGPSQAVHLRWLPRSNADVEESDVSLDPAREAVLQYNLQQSPGKMIAIRSALGDPIARQLAERFKAVFERSSWRVVGVDEVAVPLAHHGLALAGGSLPTPPDLASAYIAFTAAGFDLVPRLDPSLEPNDTVLIVA
jgi:DNA-directed RNA polymerase subunit RPC12/RpoP